MHSIAYGFRARSTASATFRAIGTTAEVHVTEHASVELAATMLRDQLAELDRAASRFRGDSELSNVNDHAGHTMHIGELLADAVDVALRAARQTGGDVDPTVGAALVALGWDVDFAQLRSRAPRRLNAARVPGWTRISFDHAARTLRIPRGTQLDLGATAKAFAADRAAAAIHARIGGGVLVNLGGDIAVHGEPPSDGWNIRLMDDHAAPASHVGPHVRITHGGLATSSTTVRRWRATDANHESELHHIIDPRTGQPAAGPWRTVSVAARTCVDANVAATAAIIRGHEAPGWLDNHGFSARLVAHDGTVELCGNWPDDEHTDDGMQMEAS